MFERIRDRLRAKRIDDDTFGELEFRSGQWEGSVTLSGAKVEVIVMAGTEGPNQKHKVAYRGFAESIERMHERARSTIEQEPDVAQGLTWTIEAVAVDDDGVIEVTYGSEGMAFLVRFRGSEVVAVERDFE